MKSSRSLAITFSLSILGLALGLLLFSIPLPSAAHSSIEQPALTLSTTTTVTNTSSVTATIEFSRTSDPTHRSRTGHVAPHPASIHAGSLPPQTVTVTATTTLDELVRFTPHSPMRVDRYEYSVVRLADWNILMVGGRRATPPDFIDQSAELYDPTTATFTDTGAMAFGRARATATLLADGRVLVAGGRETDPFSLVELYDPATRTFTPTGHLNTARAAHTATLLQNGQVLLTGGSHYSEENGTAIPIASAELYDPATELFTPTGSMTIARANHTATLLPNGKVLIAGGAPGIELYDPATGEFSGINDAPTTTSNYPLATLLPNGQVLLLNFSAPLLYDTQANTFTDTLNTPAVSFYSSATLLLNGELLVTGPGDTPSIYNPDTRLFRFTTPPSPQNPAGFADYPTATLLPSGQILFTANGTDTSLATIVAGNTFTGSLTHLAGWTNAPTIQVTLTATSEGAPVEAVALGTNRGSGSSLTYGEWIDVTPGAPITVRVPISPYARFLPNLVVAVRVRDTNGQVAQTATGSFGVDRHPPTAFIQSPNVTERRISFAWDAHDTINPCGPEDDPCESDQSGIALFQIEVRESYFMGETDWLPLLTSTSPGSTTYVGEWGHTYEFRIRATDRAGNVQDWPPSYNLRATIPLGPVYLPLVHR